MTLDALHRSSDTDALVADAERRLNTGDLRGAFAALKTALAQSPEHGAATAAMGLFLADHGDPGAAAQLLSRAMTLNSASKARVAPKLARLLAGLSLSRWHPQLDVDLRTCLAEPTVEPQELSQVAAEALLLKQAAFDGEATTLETMGRDPLWLAFLSRCLNVNVRMEARLDAVRAAVLATSSEAGEGRDALICALGVSGFASEYVAPIRNDADGAAAILFQPLGAQQEGALRDSEMRRLLVRRTVEEPARERVLAETVPILTPVEADAVSTAVRAQYEANPYPRWSAPPAPARRSLHDVIASLPGLDRRAFNGRADTVLVAGCGTGFEPIDMARMDPSLAITAMDLSRASLAHGMRVAEDLGLTQVHFVQGDILALDQVEARFDVVVSTGVIHHMAQPEAGLARLTGVVRPGGVIRLGLYSERARVLVRAAHELIREKGWSPIDADIRAFRAHVLALPDAEPLAALRESADFYSLSGCRDLVFHVREHRYTPTQLGELLTGAGLRLVGFDAPPEATAAFREFFGMADPLNLDLWDQLEVRRPTLFAGMYHLWTQKPG